MIRTILQSLHHLVFYTLLRGALRLELTLGPIELLRVAWVCRCDVLGLDFQFRGFGTALAFHFTKTAGVPKLFLVLAGLGTHEISIASATMREMEAQQKEADEVEADLQAAFDIMQEEDEARQRGVPPDLEYEEGTER